MKRQIVNFRLLRVLIPVSPFIIVLVLAFSSCNKDKDENHPPNDLSGDKGTFIDYRDHKSYEWVKIGTQTWMTRNLDFEFPAESWYYNSNSNLSATYGRLYTFHAGLLAIPEGWHIPSVEEIDVLSDYLGGFKVAGGKLKQAGNSDWLAPNLSADNSSGFNALPGGMLNADHGFYEDTFILKGSNGYFWTSTYWGDNSGVTGCYYYLSYDKASINYTEHIDRSFGFSVRCIKD